jgi:conjugal transfer mating pair stabilization protein TraG
MFGLWTQSWFPVAAILNNYAQMTSSEMLARYGIALNGNGTPQASVLTTIAGLPETLAHVQSILGNVDMMMALTPVITMIVFTGSYMAMSNMAQDINAETQAGKSVTEEAPGLPKQEQAFGVSAPGTVTGSYAVNTALGQNLSANVSSAASALDAQSNSVTASAASTYGTKVAEQASRGLAWIQGHQHALSSEYTAGDTAAQKFSTSYRAAEQWAQKHGLDESKALDFSVAYRGALNAGASESTAIKAGLAAAGGFKGADQANVKQAIADKEGLDKAKDLTTSNMAEFMRTVGHNSKDAATKSEAASIESRLGDTRSTEADLRQSLQRASAMKEEAQQMSGLGSSATVTTKALSAYALDKGEGSRYQAVGVLTGMATQADLLGEFQQRLNTLKQQSPGMDPLDAATTAYMQLAQQQPQATAVAAQRLYDIQTGVQALAKRGDIENRATNGLQVVSDAVWQGQATLAPAKKKAKEGGTAAASREGDATRMPAGYQSPRALGAGNTAQTYSNWATRVVSYGGTQIQLSQKAQDLEKQINNNAGANLAQSMSDNPTASLVGLSILNTVGAVGKDVASAVGAYLTGRLLVGATSGVISAAAGDAAGAVAGAVLGTGAVVAGVGAAGATGYAVGTLINKGIDGLIQQATNGKETSLGGLIYDHFHQDQNNPEKVAQAAQVTRLLNAGAALQDDPAFKAMTQQLQALAKEGKTAANDQQAARLTREASQMIQERAKSGP